MASKDDAMAAESRWQRLEALFHQMVEAPSDARDELLGSLCAGDASLESELRALLQASETEELLGRRRSNAARQAADSALRGRLIGPYRLDELLGRGGMGAVYLAHRADGQFEQRLAIKLIDLPLATELFRERFRLERQILAGLTHPFIARLLDGGVGESGDLYLAMEYVEGVSITRYCAAHKLTIRERMTLFRLVCEAVQFAHQNLIVHRDLKPDNILVVADGTPRLLDFGTAKLLVPVDAATAGGFTQQGLQPFTPQYASPEQILGEAITTASDTYSLGVLLYVLLSGVPPYAIREFTTGEMLRVICTEPPLRPSAAAGTERLDLRIDADLDAIVLKALRKEPLQRYVSVEQFAFDINNWLAGRPVMARRGNWRYRAAKFARRNKLQLFVSSLLVGSVVVGIAGVVWQSRLANLERQRAEARSSDLRQLSNSLLSEIDEAIKELPGSTPVQRLLVERVLEHLDRMAKDAAGDRLTQLDVVNGYTRLGNLQGNPYDQNIGDTAGALASLDKALTLARALQSPPTSGADGGDTLAALAHAEQSRSEILFGIGRTAEAVTAIRAAGATFDARAERRGATANDFADAATAAGNLGDQLGQVGVASLGDPEGAIEAYRKSLAMSQRALAIDPLFLRSLRSVAATHAKIGNMLLTVNPTTAIDEFRESIAAWQRLPDSDRASASTRRGIAASRTKVGLALAEDRDYAASIEEFESAKSEYEFFAAADAADTRAQYDLALFLSSEALTYVDMLNPVLNPQGSDHQQLMTRAIELLQRSVAIREKLVTVDSTNRGWRANLDYEKTLVGSLMQATTAARVGIQWSSSGVASLVRNASAADASIDVLDYATAAMLIASPPSLRNPAWTVSTAERLVAFTHRRKASFLLTLAQAYRQNGQIKSAATIATEGLALLPALPVTDKMPRLRTLLLVEAGNRLPL